MIWFSYDKQPTTLNFNRTFLSHDNISENVKNLSTDNGLHEMPYHSHILLSHLKYTYLYRAARFISYNNANTDKKHSSIHFLDFFSNLLGRHVTTRVQLVAGVARTGWHRPHEGP